MCNSTTFSVLFWIYTKRARNNQTNIYARITLNGKKSNISLKLKVNVNAWDPKNQKMKGFGSGSKQLNMELSIIKSDLFKCYRDLKRESRMLTPELVKARYLGTDKKQYTLKDIFEYHNQTFSHKFSKCTIGKFETTQKYLLVYVSEKYKEPDLYLQNLDYKFIVGFESFLRTYQSRPSQGKISHNVAMKHIQRLKKMIRLAYDLEWIQRDPFTRFKLKMEKREREFLTKDELKSIEELSTSIERLSIVKDLFVFSSYTGLSYIDVIGLTRDDIVKQNDGSRWIIIKRKKTNVPVKIPLLPYAEQLIIKYDGHPKTVLNSSLLPHISNQKLNSYLKEIQDLCNISKTLTFHMARHTFATTVTLTNNVPVETVSKLLGHTKIATTQIYARVVEEKIGKDMNQLRKLLESNDKRDTDHPKFVSKSMYIVR